jgi:hypothetical protein
MPDLDALAAAHLAALEAGEPYALVALERLHRDLLAVADEQRRTLAVLDRVPSLPEWFVDADWDGHG